MQRASNPPSRAPDSRDGAADPPQRAFAPRPLSGRITTYSVLFGGSNPLALSVGIYLCAACLTLRVGADLVSALAYELGGAYNHDTPMFWAVGRGVLNGLAPWRDLFENKPPGIFLLAAASIRWTGGLWLGNLVQTAVLAGTALLAFVTARLRWPKGHGQSHLSPALFVPLWLVLTLYMADRANEITPEACGEFFAVAYVTLLASTRPLRRWVKWTLSSLCLIGAVGFKEPFLLTMMAAVLILRPRVRDWLSDFIVPLALSMIVGALVLALLGWMGPFAGYLDFMLNQHVNRFGSPWRRGADVLKLVDDLNGYAPNLGWLVVLISVGALFSLLRREVATRRYLAGVRWMGAVLLTSLAVGIGGHYWDHHFTFALPTYLALLLECLPDREPLSPIRAHQAILLPWTLMVVLVLPDVSSKQYLSNLRAMKARSELAVSSAGYIDAVLDRLGDRRYTFLGAHNMQAYVWTRHSPYGPLFCQIPDFVQNAAFRGAVLNQVNRANLVVETSLDTLGEDLAKLVKERLAEDFTTVPPSCVASIPRGPGLDYRYYFRKSAETACQNR